MQAITAGCLLLLASAGGETAVPDVIHNFGIYGGTKINITEVPFMALLRLKYAETGCGASIVSPRFLVTTAECGALYSNYKYRSIITVGTDIYNGGEHYKIYKFYIHPSHEDKGVDYDISVIKLMKTLVFNNRVSAIKMADSSLIPKPGDMMETIGFGLTENSVKPKHLLSLNISFVDLKQCKQFYQDYHQFNVTDRMICAGTEEGKGTCFGDYGGPLFYKRQLIGVASWGKPCAHKNYPSVFSYVPSMRQFIDGIIKIKA